MQSIKAWARKNKRKLQKFLNANPSTVFFRELPSGLPGPIGALGVPISSERSVAIDRKFIPLGAPIFLSTTEPNSKISLNKFMIAQDTGGAINGGVRADFYWGQGKVAGSKVLNGEIQSGSNARLIRDGVIIHSGKVGSLFREKNQVKEVGTGLECGISIKDFIDFKEKDVIESFLAEEIQRSI